MPTTVADLYRLVLASDNNVADKINLLNEVRKINTAEGDRWVYRRPIAYLLGAIPVILLLAYVLGWVKEVNDGLLSLASAAVGALASFLTTGVASKPDPVAAGESPLAGAIPPAGTTPPAGTPPLT